LRGSKPFELVLPDDLFSVSSRIISFVSSQLRIG
jgi:hypothetical protein